MGVSLHHSLFFLDVHWASEEEQSGAHFANPPLVMLQDFYSQTVTTQEDVEITAKVAEDCGGVPCQVLKYPY